MQRIYHQGFEGTVCPAKFNTLQAIPTQQLLDLFALFHLTLQGI